MTSYIIRRLLVLVVLLFLVVSFVFLMIHLIPGDPAKIIAGIGARQDAIDSIRQELGLNRPLSIQYIDKLKGLLMGNMGKSLITGADVKKLVTTRFWATLELIVVGAIFSIIIGIPLGMIAARNYDGVLDNFINILATLFISLPVFVVGTFLVLIFSIKLNILPSGGYISLSENVLNHIKKIILPGITLGLGLTTVTVRIMRSSLLEVLKQDFIRTAIAKGLSKNKAFWSHGVRNALIPVITVFGVQLGYLFGGSVLVEKIFNWPGLNSLLVNAVHRRDYPIIEGTMIVITLTYFIINLVVDILYVVIDPRVSYQ